MVASVALHLATAAGQTGTVCARFVARRNRQMAPPRQHSYPQGTVLRRPLSEGSNHTLSIAISFRARRSSGSIRSIVLGTLSNPCADGIAVADRYLLVAVRHTHLRRGTPIEEPHQVAALRIPRGHHRAELGALHQAFIAGEVEPAFFVTRAAALVAAHTSAFEDRQYVLGEALRFRRAQLSRGRRHVGNHQATGAERYRGRG